MFFDFCGIDPDIFVDDDGRVYISGSSWQSHPSTINCFEVDIRNGQKLTEEKIIWDGFSKSIPEGPHLYKRVGYYYLMDAEGGTHEGHRIAIVRSNSVWGPYESCKYNSILKPSVELDHFEYVQYNRHGDLFQDTQGRWWLVCLAVRRDQEGRIAMGRESFLTAVAWPDNEAWPPLYSNPSRPTLPLIALQRRSHH